MGKPFKLGLIQVDLSFDDCREVKLGKLEHLARQCLDEGADLVFFPEAYQHCQDRGIKFRPDELRQVAGAWKERMANLAREYHAYIAPWDYEPNEFGQVYNSSYILDRNGQEIGRYHKVHLTNGELTGGVTNGDSFPVFDLDFGNVGIMICFDNYWPESARCLAVNGAEIILYPLFGDTLVPNWEIKVRCRAIDNCVYVAPCQIDKRFNVAWTGLINPEGNVVCRLDSCPSYRVVEVDLGRPVITSTMANPKRRENLAEYLRRCRQPNAYGDLLKPVENPWPWEKIFFGDEHNF